MDRFFATNVNKKFLPALPVLTAIFAVAHLDRHVLNLSLNAIGAEFNLSNTQLGLLSGAVFAVVFVIAGIPIAYLAAKGNRRNIIATSAAVWSVLTVFTALSQNYFHLLIARLGVGIGEAGAVAPAHSIISDTYGPERRTSAMATFATGANIGVLLAFLVGGVIGQQFGWRWAFVVAGVPGLLLALMLRFKISEPPRTGPVATSAEKKSMLLETLQIIWHDRGLFHALCGMAITGIVTFGALAWVPTFIIRAHGLNQAQAGIFLALSIGIAGGLGTWLSGKLADRLGKQNPKWRIGIVIIAILIAKPFVLVFLLAGHTATALTFFIGSAFVAAVFWGPTMAYVHTRLDPRLRPMGTAVFLFFFNLIGLGIGPVVIGALADTLFADQGARAIGYGLVCIQITGLWAAWHYWQVMRTVKSSSPA